MIEYPRQGILSKEIFHNENQDVTLFCMKAKSKIGDHTSAKAGFIQVIEGDGIFRLSGKNIKMSPGVFIPMKRKAVHSLSANKNTSFILYLN